MEKALADKLRSCATAGSCIRCSYHGEGCEGLHGLLIEAADTIDCGEHISDDERIRLKKEIESLKNRIRLARKMIAKFTEDWNEN